MEIKNLILHPVQLIEVELLKAFCKKTEEYSGKNEEVNYSVNVVTKDIASNGGKTEVEIYVRGEGFEIQAVEMGIFKFEKIEDREIVKKFLEIQGIRLMWSYIRETIYDFSGKLLRNPIMLPTIDVLKTVENAEEDN